MTFSFISGFSTTALLNAAALALPSSLASSTASWGSAGNSVGVIIATSAGVVSTTCCCAGSMLGFTTTTSGAVKVLI
jgi:hypothetical protein